MPAPYYPSKGCSLAIHCQWCPLCVERVVACDRRCWHAWLVNFTRFTWVSIVIALILQDAQFLSGTTIGFLRSCLNIGSRNKGISFSCSVTLRERVTKDFHVKSSLLGQRSRRPRLLSLFTARHTQNSSLSLWILPQSSQPDSILPLSLNSRHSVALLFQIHEFSKKYFHLNFKVNFRYWLPWNRRNKGL